MNYKNFTKLHTRSRFVRHNRQSITSDASLCVPNKCFDDRKPRRKINRKEHTFRIRASSKPPFWSRSTCTRWTSMLTVSIFSLSDSVTFTSVLLSLLVSLRLSSEPYTTEKRRKQIRNDFMIKQYFRTTLDWVWTKQQPCVPGCVGVPAAW